MAKRKALERSERGLACLEVGVVVAVVGGAGLIVEGRSGVALFAAEVDAEEGMMAREC